MRRHQGAKVKHFDVSNVIYHKFSHGAAFYMLSGENVNVMLELGVKFNFMQKGGKRVRGGVAKIFNATVCLTYADGLARDPDQSPHRERSDHFLHCVLKYTYSSIQNPRYSIVLSCSFGGTGLRCAVGFASD